MTIRCGLRRDRLREHLSRRRTDRVRTIRIIQSRAWTFSVHARTCTEEVSQRSLMEPQHTALLNHCLTHVVKALWRKTIYMGACSETTS